MGRRDDEVGVRGWRVVAACMSAALGLLLPMSAARADELQDRFETVWEALWYQGGSPSAIQRWNDNLRVRIHGTNLSFHRQRILDGMTLVAGVVGKTVTDVSDAPDAADKANQVIEIVGERALPDAQACYVQVKELRGAVIQRAEMKLREDAVYHCILHEAVHVMGIKGHPAGDTILSYFRARVDRITELDRLMLKAWYAPQMRVGASPFRALVVLTDTIVDAAGRTNENLARQRKFLDETFSKMELYAVAKGEVPVILKRSGKVSTDAMREGRIAMRYFLGTAYLDGNIVAMDDDKAIQWFTQAARAGHLGAQYAMGYMLENRPGATSEQKAEAYQWYRIAAAQEDLPVLRNAVARMATALSEVERQRAEARVGAFVVDTAAD